MTSPKSPRMFIAPCAACSRRSLYVLAWLNLLSILVMGASAASPEEDVILSALKDELRRSMTLKLGDLESPYFVQYAVDDTINHRWTAAFGALVSANQNRSRTLQAQVRVGSYDLDNSNFVGRAGGGFGGGGFPGRRFGSSTELPIDQDYLSLRRAVWMATDALYKSSVATLAQKRAYLQDRNVADRPPDFAKVEVPVNAIQEPSALPEISSTTVDYLRNISKLFTNYQLIQDAQVDLTVAAETRYLVNSEGAQLRYGETGVLLRITAEAQAPDGERIADSLNFYALTPQQLPDLAAVSEDVNKFAQRVMAMVQAPILENYTGPVLVDDVAAGQLIHQLLSSSITSQVDPVGFSRRGSSVDEADSRPGRRLLPSSFHIYDDPGQSQFQGKFLAGHYLFDDEGIAPQRVEVVVDGKLEGRVTSRTPAKKSANSNGHGRRIGGSFVNAAIGCLFVESKDGASPEELKQELIDAAKEEGLKFGLRVSSLQNRSGFAPGGFGGGGGFGRRPGGGGGGPGPGRSVGNPIAIFKVYVDDGREESVRGCQFAAVDVRSLRRILAAGKTQTVHNSISAGSAASSVVAPAMLFEELELSRVRQETERRPTLLAPHARPDAPAERR